MTQYQYDCFVDYLDSGKPPLIIQEALLLLAHRLKRDDVMFRSSRTVKEYCRLKLGAREHEVFAVLFLDTQHRSIGFKELFRGTINECSVYPREVVKEALAVNAAAVIFTHNHPSGCCEPSREDIYITDKLKKALSLIDVNVLDHIVVSAMDAVSLSERGQI